MREVHAGLCEHPYTEALICDACDVGHGIVVCRDCRDLIDEELDDE